MATAPRRLAQARRPRFSAGEAFKLARTTLKEWSEDKVPRLGASLAYYTVFSIAPMLVIAIAIAGLVFDPAEVQRAVLSQMGGLVGPDGAELIRTMLESAQNLGTGLLAAGLGLVTLVLGALGAFGQLQDALNTIWEVKPRPGRGLRGILQDRLLSLSMVLVVGFLLLVSLVLSTALSAVGGVVGGLLPESELLLSIINFGLSFVVITVLFALMFKYLPDAKINWRDVWIGAAITALLFTLGKQLIGLYLGNASVTSSYGAAGSLVVLLLWVYYSAQIFLLGAEFTQVYANQYGSRVRPAENAVAVTDLERAKQGIPHSAPAPEGERSLGVGAPGQRMPQARQTGETRPAAETPPEPSYLVALVTFIVGLGAGATLAGRRDVDARGRSRRQR